MKAIIFSKNRACQLDLLLRSMKRHLKFVETDVIYVATTPEFLRGYAQIREDHPGVRLLNEKNLKKDLLRCIVPSLNCLLVDDDVFYRDVPFTVPDHGHTFSLRLHERISQKHFDYLHSVDGNVYWGDEIGPCLEAIEFENPNRLESRLQRFNSQFTIDYGEGYVVNCPHNRVSDGSHCEVTGRHTAKDLNNHYLRGERLHIDPTHFTDLKDVHVDIPYAFRSSSAS